MGVGLTGENSEPLVGLIMVTLGGVSFTEINTVDCADRPPLSVTVKVTLNLVGVPEGTEKVCAGFAWELTEEPSPKFHEYVSVWPSGSIEPLLLNCTVNGLAP